MLYFAVQKGSNSGTDIQRSTLNGNLRTYQTLKRNVRITDITVDSWRVAVLYWTGQRDKIQTYGIGRRESQRHCPRQKPFRSDRDRGPTGISIGVNRIGERAADEPDGEAEEDGEYRHGLR